MTIRTSFWQAKQQLGLTFQNIVYKTGLSYATVAHLCSPQGEYSSCSLETLDKFCDCFGYLPEQLIHYSAQRRLSSDGEGVVGGESSEPKIHTIRREEKEGLHTLQMSILSAFIYEYGIMQPGLSIRKKDFWEVYQRWCAIDPDKRLQIPRRAMEPYLREFLQITDKRNGQGQWVWVGMCLQDSARERVETEERSIAFAAEYIRERDAVKSSEE